MTFRARRGLSPKQREVLLAIADLLNSQRWPPSFEEIGKKADVTPGSVAYVVIVLTADGYVERGASGYRTMDLTDAGKKLVKQLRKKAA